MGASISLANHVPRLKDVWPIAHPANAASRRVLQKAGVKIARFAPKMNRIPLSPAPAEATGRCIGPTRVEAVTATSRDSSWVTAFRSTGTRVATAATGPWFGEGRGDRTHRQPYVAVL